MPSAPMRSRSTKPRTPRKSTTAEKSSTKTSGEAMLRTAPEFSPVVDWSKASVTKPRSASVCAYRPLACSFTAPNGPEIAMAG